MRHHKGYWFGFGPWGFSFGFPFKGWGGPFPFFWETMEVEEELEMLRQYKRHLEEELKRVNERIQRLEGKGE